MIAKLVTFLHRREETDSCAEQPLANEAIRYTSV